MKMARMGILSLLLRREEERRREWLWHGTGVNLTQEPLTFSVSHNATCSLCMCVCVFSRKFLPGIPSGRIPKAGSRSRNQQASTRRMGLLNLRSSVASPSLIFSLSLCCAFYGARLPSRGYFFPFPRNSIGGVTSCFIFAPRNAIFYLCTATLSPPLSFLPAAWRELSMSSLHCATPARCISQSN